MKKPYATLVASARKSLANRDGNSVLPSERGAALLSAMKLEGLSSENCQTVIILVSILQGITANTVSGDVIYLGLYRAAKLCQDMGIEQEVFDRVVERYLKLSDNLRKGLPYAY